MILQVSVIKNHENVFILYYVKSIKIWVMVLLAENPQVHPPICSTIRSVSVIMKQLFDPNEWYEVHVFLIEHEVSFENIIMLNLILI